MSESGFETVRHIVDRNFDPEKFISVIESKPVLYNTDAHGHSSREVRMRAWNEVAVEMYEDFDSFSSSERCELNRALQTRWKSIRDQFKKDLRKFSHHKGLKRKKRKYIYSENLQFLLPYTSDRQKMPEPEFVKVDESIDLELGQSTTGNESGSSDPVSPSSFRPRDVGRSSCSSLLRQRLESADVAEDKLGNRDFLISLLPYMNKLPEEELLKVRLKLLHVLQDAYTAAKSREKAYSSSASVSHSAAAYESDLSN